MMKKNKKKSNQKEEMVLHIEISDESSELVMRLDSIIREDIASQKLPTISNNPQNKRENDKK